MSVAPPPPPRGTGDPSNRWPWVALALGALVIVIAVIVFYVNRPSGVNINITGTPTPNPVARAATASPPPTLVPPTLPASAPTATRAPATPTPAPPTPPPTPTAVPNTPTPFVVVVTATPAPAAPAAAGTPAPAAPVAAAPTASGAPPQGTVPAGAQPQPTPAQPTSAGPTPFAGQVSNGGGLGNTRSDFDSAYGAPTGQTPQGLVAYSKNNYEYHVAFVPDINGRASMVVTLPPNGQPVALEQAQSQAHALLPKDAQPPNPTPEGNAQFVAERYNSQSLAQALPPQTFGNSAPGDFMIVYLKDAQGRVTRWIMGPGDDPNALITAGS